MKVMTSGYVEQVHNLKAWEVTQIDTEYGKIYDILYALTMLLDGGTGKL